MIPLMNAFPAPAAAPQDMPVIRQVAFRRQLTAELTAIHTCIVQSGLHDDITQSLLQWQQDFMRDLRRGDERQVLNQYSEYLLRMLQGPIEACLIPDVVMPPGPSRPHPVISHIMDWLKNHAPRELFRAQLAGITRTIAQSGLEDEMTRNIDTWKQHFMQALQAEADPRETGTRYITLLQQLMRDSITSAPLDEGAVLGSDGNTYGQMSLDVYLLTVPAIYRGRSPLNANNPAPFTTTPHSCARHMVRFLRSYHALQESLELRQNFNRLMAQQQVNAPMDAAVARQERLNRIYARTAAANQAQAQRLRQQRGNLDRQLENGLAAFNAQVNQLVAPLRQQVGHFHQEGNQQLDDLDRRDEAQARDVQNQLGRADENQIQAMNAAAARLEAVMVQQRAIWQASQQDLNRAIEEDREALGRVQHRVEAAMEQGFAPLTQQIQAFAQVTAEQLVRRAQQDQEAIRQIEVLIQELERDIARLEQGNQDLQHDQIIVAGHIRLVQHEEVMLRRGIQETERIIKEREKNNKMQLVQTVATVGACLFATWGLQSILEISGSSATCTVNPLKGGGMLKWGFAW